MFGAPEEWTLSFSGHESFPLRFSWLPKAFSRVSEDAAFFGREDSMVELGVGKNMVSSIRHWGLATQSWAEEPGSRGKFLHPTPFGQAVFGEGDPAMEHPGTHWALHWRISVNQDKATTWAIVFNRPASRFMTDQLLQELAETAARHGNKRASRASLKRDIDVFCRSYLQPMRKRGAFQEDELDCPFKQLGLLRNTSQRGELELVAGNRPSLPLAVFEFALLEHLQHGAESARQEVAAENLLYGWNSPGRVFRLTEAALMDRLEGLAAEAPHRYLIDETVGMRRFVLEPTDREPIAALQSYYQQLQEGVLHAI
jgi:hypothetical protein